MVPQQISVTNFQFSEMSDFLLKRKKKRKLSFCSIDKKEHIPHVKFIYNFTGGFSVIFSIEWEFHLDNR